MVRAILAASALLAFAIGPLRADVAQDATVCADEKVPPARAIDACSGVVGDAQVSADVKFAAYMRRADAYFSEKGDIPRAIADASEAIKLGPDRPEGYYLRGGVYLANNEFDKAVADFSAVIKMNPDDTQALAGRAYAYRQSGDNDRAVADYSEVIRLRPDDANAYYDRGGAYEKKEDFDRARADYNQAIRLQRDYAGEFQENCLGAGAKGERVLTNWPACEADEKE